MNYRHAFHAGNFADVVKHAALLALLDRLMAEPAPLTVVDTHAGAGLYDLTDAGQARSKEAEAGVQRLLAEEVPAPLEALAGSVRARNRGAVETYPGSPALVLERLRTDDRLVAFELQPQVHARLSTLLSEGPAEAKLEDGFAGAAKTARLAKGRLFVLIDPPFERSDDYVRIVETVGGVVAANPKAAILVWLPLKDLETLDAFIRRLEALKPAPCATIAETRVRPLRDPMRMNGCVLVAIGAPEGFDADLEAISGAVVGSLGEPGASAKLWRIGR